MTYSDRDARYDRQYWLCTNLKRAALALAMKAWHQYKRTGSETDFQRATYHASRARHLYVLSEKGYPDD